jgi:glycosyltransferase involved in cell wall biosynthesis
MKVMVCGLRGFPDVQGGVETHSQHLYPLLADRGCDVTVLTRSHYQHHPESSWKRVKFVRIWSPTSAVLEAIVHTFLCILYAAWKRPDLLHIHAIGPALVVPLARLFGLRVVVTHHGPDYDREKWGSVAKRALKFGEKLGMRWANRRIVISEVINHLVMEKYDLSCDVVHNGVDVPVLDDSFDAGQTYGLEQGKYVLLVSRIVPEKRHLDLIRAFRDAGLPDWKLVLVGGADHGSAYEQKISRTVEGDASVICTGFLRGQALQELYANAGIFVLPSSHEGLPIALLEAMSFGLCCVASDIPAHLSVGLPNTQIFRLGNVVELAERLQHFAGSGWSDEDKARVRAYVSENYDWSEIADQTYKVYEQAITG